MKQLIVGNTFSITLRRDRPHEQQLDRETLMAIAVSLSTESLRDAGEFLLRCADGRGQPSIVDRVMLQSEQNQETQP